MLIKRRFVIMSFAASLILYLPGQAQQTAGENNSPAATVEFLFSITAKKGPARPVNTADFSVFDNGTKQNLSSVRPAKDLPLALGILVDASTQKLAYNGGFSLVEEEQILSAFQQNSIRPQDQSMWIRFVESSVNLAGLIDLSNRAGMQQAVELGRSPGAGAEHRPLLSEFLNFLAEALFLQELQLRCGFPAGKN